MSLVKSPFTFRKGSHIYVRLELRGERIYADYVTPWFMLTLVAYSVIDKLNIPSISIWYFVSFRTICALSSYVVFYVTRGRLPYVSRAFFTGSFYVYCVEYLMIRYDLLESAYFAGLFLIMACSITIFPLKFLPGLLLYTLYFLPVFIICIPGVLVSDPLALTTFAISWGGVVTSSFISMRMRTDQIGRLQATEELTRDLGKRSAEVERQTEELLRRKIFEKQFSPQVVKTVLQSPQILQEVRQYRTVTLVIDIESSTEKADSLDPKVYQEVIEEVIDIFSACCLKNNITIDKFTGDGFLAFAGAPVSSDQDLRHALDTCRDLIQMLQSRRAYLNLRWGTPLNVRFAVCEGNALVGFLGRGSYRNFSAIGKDVNAAFRISAVPDPWQIAVCSTLRSLSDELSQIYWAEVKPYVFENLKGFKQKIIPGAILIPIELESLFIEGERCRSCGTPMIVLESGLNVRLICPSCKES